MFYEQFRNKQLNERSCGGGSSVDATKKDVVRVATKRVAEKMRNEGSYQREKSKKRFVSAINEMTGKPSPSCPVGYKWNTETLRCEPRRPKDSVMGSSGSGNDSTPGNGPGYGVIGATGLNGDGYAFAERTADGMMTAEGAQGYQMGGIVRRKNRRERRKCRACGAMGGCGCRTYSNFIGGNLSSSVGNNDDNSDSGEGGDGGGGMGEAYDYNKRAKQIARNQFGSQTVISSDGQARLKKPSASVAKMPKPAKMPSTPKMPKPNRAPKPSYNQRKY